VGLALFPCGLFEGTVLIGPTLSTLHPFASHLMLVKVLLPSGAMHSQIGCACAPSVITALQSNTAGILMSKSWIDGPTETFERWDG
jgi:hypothetical protein